MQQNLGIQDSSNDKRYFTIIPNYILNHSTIWDREVYIQMKRIAGENGLCWTSQKTLAKQCGMGITRLKKSLKYLLEHNWISDTGFKRIETRGGAQEVNQYRITDLWKLNTDYYASKGVSSENTPSENITKGASPGNVKGSREIDKGSSPGVHKEEPINNITVKEERSNASVAGKEINDLIDLFKDVNPSWERLFADKTQRACIERLVKKIGKEKVEGAIKILRQTNGMKFAPVITTPFELEKKLGLLIAYVNKEKNNINKNKIGIL